MNFLFFVQINDIIMYKKNERELFTIKEETYSFQKNKKERYAKKCVRKLTLVVEENRNKRERQREGI